MEQRTNLAIGGSDGQCHAVSYDMPLILGLGLILTLILGLMRSGLNVIWA